MSSWKPTPDQSAAVSTLDQNVAVLAGAGTGKTHVLVERFLSIIEQRLAVPSEILAITFTEKAANEMKKRIVEELRNRGLNQARHEIENAYIGTIHAFCSRILREHPMEAGIDPDFRVCEEEEADLLKEAVFEQMIEERFHEESVLSLFSTYDEDVIGKRIKSVYDEIRSAGISHGEALKHDDVIDRAALRRDAVQKLSALFDFKRTKSKAETAITHLETLGEPSWKQVDLLQEIDAWFDRRSSKDKEESGAAKDAIMRLIESEVETLSLAHKQAFESLLIDFERRYTSAKRERALFDFSDLETTVLRLLTSDSKSSEAVRKRYQKQFKFIMVDEFQDTNAVQVQILERLSGSKNLFLVGDVKQSIYGFRGALPEIFQKKQNEFESQQSGVSITLSDNFRSRAELLDFINPFFESLWENEKVHFEPLVAKKYFDELIDLPVELIAVDKEEDETTSETRAEEARVIAMRIRELAGQGYQYGDFAILFRASESMHFYEQELRNLQIPHYVIGGRGFYHQPEIRDMMNFLIILENPLREIEFASVLRSPMFQITDDTLYWLSSRAKKLNKRAPLYDGFKIWPEISEISDAERSKLEKFQIIFNALLEFKGKTRISELLESIFIKTRYDLYVLGLQQGKRHFANLRKLVDLARELEEREMVHLGDFVRYVKGLVRHEVREAEAQVEAEEDNVVRLLTIHKAKGLEFKCVIVPDLARKKNHSDTHFLYDAQLGLGLRALNPYSGEFENSTMFTLIKKHVQEREARESKRLLYVAMTRAKERLIFAGTSKLTNPIKPDSVYWFDWLRLIIGKKNLSVRKLDTETANLKFRSRKTALIDSRRVRSKIANVEAIPIKKMPSEVSQILEQTKPYPAEFFERVDLPVSAYVAFGRDPQHAEFRKVYELGAKTQPSDLKLEEDLLNEADEIISPAEFGTLVHQIFEHLVNWKSSGAVPIDEWLSYYGSDFDASVKNDARKLVDIFLQSKLLSQIQNAKRVFTELPFVLRLHHGIVQGTLDLIYETANGDYVIVDYKTSEVNPQNLQEKGESYRAQMELYMLACREILGVMPVKAVLYFVKMDAAYSISLETQDSETLKAKFEGLQKDIIQFRKNLTAGTKLL